jgi:hypothetical protein
MTTAMISPSTTWHQQTGKKLLIKIKQIGQHNIKKDTPTRVKSGWMDKCSLVLHKEHPQILSSGNKMFVAKFLPNLFMAFGKIIHNADRLLKSTATRPDKTKPSGTGRRRLPRPVLDRDARGHPRPSSKTMVSSPATSMTEVAARDRGGGHARITCAVAQETGGALLPR